VSCLGASDGLRKEPGELSWSWGERACAVVLCVLFCLVFLSSGLFVDLVSRLFLDGDTSWLSAMVLADCSIRLS
jgi:hypothetical protein